MHIYEALTLVVLMLPLAAMPSASVALVVAKSVSSGRASGACSALGIVTGDIVFIVMALVGMTVLAGWLGAVFSIVKVFAAIYLIWLGVGLLRSKLFLTVDHDEKSSVSYLADFIAGLLLTLGDIKAILFYASLFPTLIDVERITILDGCIIAAITAFTVGGVKLAYVMFASEVAEKFGDRVASDIPRILGGALLLTCGLFLIVKA